MSTKKHAYDRGLKGLLAVAACGFALSPLGAPTVEGQTTAGRFTEGGFIVSGGAQKSFGDWSASQGEVRLDLNVLHLDDHRYKGAAIGASYTWDDDLDFLAFMARVDFGLGRGVFGGRDPVGYRTGYWSLMAGYGSGTLWDLAFIPRFGQEDRVEIDVSGVPLYFAVGYRRVGRIALMIEATAGAILITTDTPYEPEGVAPSAIPSIGIKLGFGWDTFAYVR